MTPDDLLDLIGIEISPARLKCALLSLDTVAHALADEAAAKAEAGGSASASSPGFEPGPGLARRRRAGSAPRTAGAGRTIRTPTAYRLSAA